MALYPEEVPDGVDVACTGVVDTDGRKPRRVLHAVEPIKKPLYFVTISRNVNRVEMARKL